MRKVSIGIMLLMIVGMMFGNAFAEHDYFGSFNVLTGWSFEPTVCILDPPKDKTYIILSGVDMWEQAFHYLGIYNHDYSIFVLDKTDYRCDINIKFVTAEEVTKRGGTPVGATVCNETNDLWFIIGDYKTLIRPGERICNIYVNPDWGDSSAINSIVVHEMGHALGIDHRSATDPEGFAAVILTRDIMFKELLPYPLMTAESIDALQSFYGNGGWGELVSTDVYIIPH